LNHNNNASLIRRELLVRTGRLALAGGLAEGVDRIPYDMTAEGWETIRCCIHHDRAILRLRTMAILGGNPGGLDDVDRPLADYAREAGKPDAAGGAAADGAPVLTVISEACNACVLSRFLVTEACQGCLARPCKMNCPKNAIAFHAGRARIDADTCVNCGLCQKNCPYTAIVKIPVPCEEACPVGAISKGEDGVERIDESKCVLCGKCLKECPFGAVAERSDYIGLCLGLAKGKRYAALVAPAVAVQFPGGFGRFSAALKKLGFEVVLEVAEGADLCAADEAHELSERMERGEGFLATSCCPSWVRTAEKWLPALRGRVSSTPSPLAYTARLAAEKHPGCERVFIGPCVAKRGEGRDLELVDAVITGEELGALFVAADIDVNAIEAGQADNAASAKGRGFAASGGVAAAVLAELAKAGKPAPRFLAVNGVNRQAVKLMETWALKAPEADLVEVMACEGGCIGGPCLIAPQRVAKAELDKMLQ
jgi:[FeFe] hydrogenase (group B1/B3)